MPDRTNRPALAPVRRLLTGALASGLALTAWGSLSGCGQESEAAAKVRAAEAQLSSVGGGETTGADSYTRGVYADVARDLQSAGSGASDGDAASASLVLARAKMGLGEAAAESLVERHAELLRRVGAARASLASWIDRQSEAASLEAFDPSDEQRSIAAARSERVDLREQAEAEIERLTSAFAEFEAAAAAATQSATSARSSALAVQEDMDRSSATRAASLASRLRELRRQGDAFERTASDYEAQMDLLRPEIETVELQIRALASQINRLDQRRIMLDERQTQLRSDAADERRLAAEAAAMLDDRLGEIRDLLEGDLGSAATDAISQFRDAASQAQRARSAIRDEASRTAGAARRRMADSMVIQASGYDAVASHQETAAASEPAPPSASDYRQRAVELRQSQSESLEAAAEAYETAISELSAGAPSDDAARLERTLQMLARSARGGSIDLAALSQPVTQDNGFDDFDDADDFGAPDQDSAEATIRAILDAGAAADAGGFNAGALNPILLAGESVRFNQPELDGLIGDLLATLRSIIELDSALIDEYGDDLATLAENSRVLAGIAAARAQAEALADGSAGSGSGITMDNIIIEPDGDDTAYVTITEPDSGETVELTMRRDGFEGGWYVDLSQFLTADGQSFDLSAAGDDLAAFGAPTELPIAILADWRPIVSDFGAAIENVAVQVRDGSFDDAQSAINAMDLTLQPLLFRALALAEQQGVSMQGGAN
mgnify:CR=1 FL=1